MVELNMKKIRMYQTFNVLGYILTILVNALANILPINGQGTGEVSDAYPNLFAPAGFTFSIWGVIYLALGLFVIYQLGFFSKGRQEHLKIVARIKWSFLIASLANSAWIFAWHYEQMFKSVLIILILLISLLDIYEAVNKEPAQSSIERISVQGAFSIYLSWISVATIANITTFLVSINWNGFGISIQTWAMIVILVATVLTLSYVFNKHDIPYACVTLWALFGILYKHLTFFKGDYKGVIVVTIMSMVIILISIFMKPRAMETLRS